MEVTDKRLKAFSDIGVVKFSGDNGDLQVDYPCSEDGVHTRFSVY